MAVSGVVYNYGTCSGPLFVFAVCGAYGRGSWGDNAPLGGLSFSGDISVLLYEEKGALIAF